MLWEKFSVITDQGAISISINHHRSQPTNKMILHYVGEEKKGKEKKSQRYTLKLGQWRDGREKAEEKLII